MENRVYNFAAGPCCLPFDALYEAQRELLNWHGTAGMSVMEMSHRGKHFQTIYDAAVSDIRRLLEVPETHEIMFMQGGATLQFAALPLNLLPTLGDNEVDYAVTGIWSNKAVEEAKKYARVNVVCKAADANGFNRRIPLYSTWTTSDNAKYLHYCDNETVDGLEFNSTPSGFKSPLIADMSSNFCSKPINFEKHLAVYAGVQKNLGPAGCAVVIMDKSAIAASKPMSICPTLMNYQITARNSSMYNTPPCWTIYMTGLIAKYLLQKGGIQKCLEERERKSGLLYDFIDSSEGFYTAPVEKAYRSKMNVPFTIDGGNKALESRFTKQATEKGLVCLEGHRSVGGCRASVYNAMPYEGVEALVAFMKEFKDEHLQNA